MGTVFACSAVYVVARTASMSCASLSAQLHESTASAASASSTGPSANSLPPAADMPPAGLLSQTINPLKAAVAIVVGTSTYEAIGYGSFQLKLVRRLTVVDNRGVLTY